jgi:hypothetical protein
METIDMQKVQRIAELRAELHGLTGEHDWRYVGFDVLDRAGEVSKCTVCGKLRNDRGPGY